MEKIPKYERLMNLVSCLLKSRVPVPWSRIRGTVVGYDDDAAPETIRRRFERDKDELRAMGIPVRFAPSSVAPSLPARISSGVVSEDTGCGREKPRKAGPSSVAPSLPARISSGVVSEDTGRGREKPRKAGPSLLISEFQEEGYTIARDECFLPPLDITPQEALALSCLSGVGGGVARDALLDGVRSALIKLRSSAPAAFAESAEESLLLDTGLAPLGKTEQNLRELRSAVLERKTVEFNYRSLEDGSPRTRTVDPYGMALFEGRWYLVGRSHERRALRVWNMERITGNVKRLNRKSSGADFEPPEDFRVEDYVGVPGWLLYRGRERVGARIWFHSDIAWMIAESAAAAGDARREKFTPDKDGSGVLEVKMADPRALVQWTLKFKDKAEILSPPELRDLAKRILTEMWESG